MEAARELGRISRLYRQDPDGAESQFRGAFWVALNVGLTAQAIQNVSGFSVEQLKDLHGDPYEDDPPEPDEPQIEE